jgi:ATP-binding cassette subfamily B protein
LARHLRNAPEVVQTSWLDCGPAALTALLRGFGAPAPYERLRTMCNTGVDGTSIDSIESVAIAAGLDAMQMVVPIEQILAMPEEYLPGIVVTVLPDGFAHFVVLWRRGRRRVFLMDPAAGRKSQRLSQFASELYTHDLEVPADMWREWAGGPEFSEGLLRRAMALGVGREASTALVLLALEDEGPHSLAALDAALRTEERNGVRRRGGTAVLDRLREQIISKGSSLDPSAWSCVIPEVVEQAEHVTLRGAVLMRARAWSPEAATPQARVQLQSPEPNPYQSVIDAVKRVSWLPITLVLIALAIAVAQASQLLAFRSLLVPGGIGFGWLIVIVMGLALVRGLGSAGSLLLGRHLDSHIRAAWLRAPGALPASFIRSRPVSDIVFRAHSTHRLRDFPPRAVQFLTAVFIGIVAMATAMIVAPQTTGAVVLLFLVSVTIPWLFSRALAQADLRAQTLSGCLARPVSDALLGSQSLRQKGVGPALLAEHDVLAAGWEAALRRLTVLTGLSRVAAGVTAVVALTWCLYIVEGESSGLTLLILVLGILIIDAGSTCAQVLQTLPTVRSTLLRQSGPLNAVHIGRRRMTGVDGAEAAIILEQATVQSGSVDLIRGVSLVIPPRTHVAVVGATGSGKSTLLSVVLGTTELSEGSVRRAGEAGHDSVAWAAPAAWLWDDTVRGNVAFTTTTTATTTATATASTIEERLSLVGAESPEALAGRDAGEGGTLLSDGEAQRVRLARALGRPEAAIVVLDEAMRGLPRGERSAVLHAVREVWSSSVVLCALHEVGDAVTFDLVIVMDHGQVGEFGDPRVLLTDPDSRFSALVTASEKPPTGWERIDLGSSAVDSDNAQRSGRVLP